MAEVALVTGSYGDHDPLRPVTPDRRVDCIAFTDDPEAQAKGWSVHVDTSRRQLDPRLAAKWPKFARPRLFDGYSHVVWVDAAFQVVDAHHAYALAREYGSAPLAAHRHPMRFDITAELYASEWMPKYEGQPLHEQVMKYREEGLPERHGLWATGVLVWNRSQVARHLGHAWWEECARWSVQDQLSLPYVLWRCGVQPARLPGNVYEPGWVRHMGHRG